MAGKPAFHLFRFPIHVRPGFLMFMVLVVFIHPGEFGIWLAGSAAVLTLLHELGHAFAARATGAEAEISLDFLAGYASFVPTRALKRWERAGISIAGPAVQISVGVFALMLMGASPIHVNSFTDTAAIEAIRWTGPVMGLFNLVPVLPLDGGNIAMAGLDLFVPGRARKPMLWFSVGLTVLAAVYLFTNPRLQGLGYFVIFPLLVQIQMLTAVSRPPRRPSTAGADGEARAWATNDLSTIPDGLVPSPWYRAWQQLRVGDADTARAVLLDDLVSTEGANWWPPDTAPRETLATLVGLLPRPLPHGRAYSELALVRVLQRIGYHDDAVRYGAEAFRVNRTSAMALMVAQSSAVLREPDTALAWLGAGIQAGNDLDGIADGMDRLSDFDALRGDERFRSLRAGLDET